MQICLCPRGRESLFLPVLWKSYDQTPFGLQVRFPRDSGPLWDPKGWEVTWGSEPSPQWENYPVLFSSPVESPEQNVGLILCDWHFPPAVFPPYEVSSLSLSMRCLPLVGSVFIFAVCRTASCDFGALTGRNEHTLPTLPPWTRSNRYIL